jgi:hypothetical protein
MDSSSTKTAELDLHLYYVPPMEYSGGAIVLTRTVELPFAPTGDVSIHSRQFDGSPSLSAFI